MQPINLQGSFFENMREYRAQLAQQRAIAQEQAQRAAAPPTPPRRGIDRLI